jgi:integrase/recombinase XerD
MGTLPAGLSIEAPADRALVLIWLNNQTPLTRAAYATDIAAFFALMGKPLADVTLADVQGFAHSLIERGFKPATQARKLASVKSLYSMALKLGLLTHNPAALVQKPVSKDVLQERIVSQPAVMLMIDREINPRNKLVLRVLYGGGLRISELVGLVWSDLKARGKAGEFTVFGKGSKTRTVAIGPNLWRQIVATRDGAGLAEPVFSSRQGGPLDRAQIHRIVKRAAKRLGLPAEFSAHWLRHAHASHALDNGANVHEVQKTLGHASLNTTTRYAHAKRSSSDFLPD